MRAFHGFASIAILISLSPFLPAAEHAAAPTTRPAPASDLTPEQVVRTVMDALQDNDADDTGIAITFDFASPQNKEATGPLERFAEMVKGPVYAPMLNFKSAEYGEIKVVDDEVAEQAVRLVAANGETAVYVFRLSKQPDGEFKDCWMTDGVMRLRPRDADDGAAPDEEPPGDGRVPV